MKQYEAVIQTLERLGGVATLAQLYAEVFKITDCKWATKTPYASIRRIVQDRREIYKIKPGLYGLVSHRNENEARGILTETEKNSNSKEIIQSNHSYYQGMLLVIGKLRKYDCWAPNQDRNRTFLNERLGSLRTLQQLPQFSYPHLVKRSASIDVIWFNQRKMPRNFFEVEHSTDIQNSLLKFHELQDFSAKMYIVSHSRRKADYERKLKFSAFNEIKNRVNFVDYEWLVKEYEHAMASVQHPALD